MSAGVSVDDLKRVCGLDGADALQERVIELDGSPDGSSSGKAPLKRGEQATQKRKTKSGREQRKSTMFVDPESFVAHFIPVEAFFSTKKVAEGAGGNVRGLGFAAVPPSAGHGLGTSPSASTKQKPHRRGKYRKIKTRPTGK